MAVISLRLKERDVKRLSELSDLTHKDKSTVARELLEYGWEFLMIQQYREREDLAQRSRCETRSVG